MRAPFKVSLRPIIPADRAPIEAIVRATGVFNEAEVAVALELVDAPLSAGYRFIVAEVSSSLIAGAAGSRVENAPTRTERARVAGYSCFGATPMTDGVWDLYWIAVDPTLHGAGVGQMLMQATESAIRDAGGRMVMIETASKPSYDKTRAFYLKYGCREVARVPDFYARGDDKVMYARVLR